MENFLYIISTPIGNLDDFSYRGKELLQKVDHILCEDTRVTTKLLSKFGIKKQLIVYNDYTSINTIPKVIENILIKGTKYALVSDAGTPLISDPGYKLIQACIRNGISYTSIPGACAAVNALVLSGMPSDRFLFAGFVDKKKFKEISNVNCQLIFYESPKRLIETLRVMKEYFYDRQIAIVREMTKIFEQTIRGTLDDCINYFSFNIPKGEIVLVLSSKKQSDDNELSVKKILDQYEDLISIVGNNISKKELSNYIASKTSISKRVIYNYLINR